MKYLLLGLALFSAPGCSSKLVRVKPYERGNLASPLMLPDRDALYQEMIQHAYFSREGSFGGGGVGGGGCGCN
jgi:hypothetical protein